MIARKVRFSNLDVAYTAGLLHDIGKVILNRSMKDTYHEVVERVSVGDMPFNQVELEILGFDHAIVGSRVASKWHLPEQLVEAIAWHHDPRQAQTNPQLTAIVHIADAVCMAMGIGIGVDGMLYAISDGAMELLGLDEMVIEKSISELTDVFCDQQVFNLG